MTIFPAPTKVYRSNTYATLSPDRPELSAASKTVLITGGGTGIGAETAHRFAQAGASMIAILGRREQPLLDTKASIETQYPQAKVSTYPVDITDASQVDAAFKDFVRNGKLEILISNAAKTGPMESVENVDTAAFLESINENLHGAINVAKAFLQHAAEDAVVIETNSSGAHVNFGTGFASYSVAKLGVFRIWDSLAFAKPKMRVYHVQPGVVDTAMNREAGGVAAVGGGDDVSLPATFYVWLASPEGAFLKGKFLWANWDVDELKLRAKELESSTDLTIGLVGWPWGEAPFKFESKDESAGDQWK